MYREARRIGPTCVALRDLIALRADQWAVDVIFVDDGSDDGTPAALARSFPPDARQFREFRHTRNRGKGAAVATGVREANGELILICDADLSAPLSQFDRLLSAIDAGADIAIGSRDLPDSQLVPAQPLARRLAAWAFRALRRRLLLPALRDTQCGFKLFRRHVAQELFGQLQTPGWLFDCEILARAAAAGRVIAEVPITWQNDPDSRVRPLRDAWPALRSLWRIRRMVAAADRDRHEKP